MNEAQFEHANNIHFAALRKTVDALIVWLEQRRPAGEDVGFYHEGALPTLAISLVETGIIPSMKQMKKAWAHAGVKPPKNADTLRQSTGILAAIRLGYVLREYPELATLDSALTNCVRNADAWLRAKETR